jgi:secondary thiamine-phosphate synthase enzyme
MKAHSKLLWFHTKQRSEIINITHQVEDVIEESGISDGLALIYPMHTSSAVYVSDSDPALTGDLAALLAKLAPRGAGYHHDQTDPKENADAHLQAILCGHHVTVSVSKGRVDLGTYQTVYYAEFDGGRDKEVLVKVVGV